MASSTDQSTSKGSRKRMSSPEVVDAPTKRVKSNDGVDTTTTEGSKNKSNGEQQQEEKPNPYLAHWNNNENGGQKKGRYSNALPEGSPLHDFIPRQTDAKQAARAEDSDNNPFTGEPHSQQYFAILKTRRNLPVHKQR